jgi:hypothetical protein
LDVMGIPNSNSREAVVSVVTVELYKYMAAHNSVQQFACTACSDMYRPFVQSDCLVHCLRCGAWKEDGTGRERKGREAKVSHPQPQTGSGRSGARRNRRIQPSRFLNLSPAMDDSAGSIPRHSTATVPGLTLPVCPWPPCEGGDQSAFSFVRGWEIKARVLELRGNSARFLIAVQVLGAVQHRRTPPKCEIVLCA